MATVFYVSRKADGGGYEPLGVMTMDDAFRWAWDHGHCALGFVPLGNGQAVQATERGGA